MSRPTTRPVSCTFSLFHHRLNTDYWTNMMCPLVSNSFLSSLDQLQTYQTWRLHTMFAKNRTIFRAILSSKIPVFQTSHCQSKAAPSRSSTKYAFSPSDLDPRARTDPERGQDSQWQHSNSCHLLLLHSHHTGAGSRRAASLKRLFRLINLRTNSHGGNSRPPSPSPSSSSRLRGTRAPRVLPRRLSPTAVP